MSSLFSLSISSKFGALPTLLFPFIQNSWFFVASYVLYMTTLRAIYPAWAELIKVYVPKDEIGKLISKGTSLTYFTITIIPLLFSFWLDLNPTIWAFLFVLLGLIQLANTLFLLHLPELKSAVQTTSSPWKKGATLLKTESQFTHYLLLFFLGGAGLVAIQPVLPKFFHDNLGLSYTQLTLAISLCKGIGFICTSSSWAAKLKEITLYRLNAFINLFSCLFIIFLLSAEVYKGSLFVAYLLYGAMQAGCELSWNISGLAFSKEKESTPYSNLNLAFVGIRGCICPFAGQLLFTLTSAKVVFISAAILCLVSILYALHLDSKYKSVEVAR